MALKIVILEDNKDRQKVMADCLADRFHQYERRFFETSSEAIRFLDQHLSETIVIALDHDLELKEAQQGQLVDGGTGREVADFLASKSPVCTVLIHSTNSAAVQGMEMVLQEAHWETKRIIPWGDLEWIPSQWLRAIRQAILDSAREKIEKR
jgi:CheY-like chemotaxis protein